MVKYGRWGDEPCHYSWRCAALGTKAIGRKYDKRGTCNTRCQTDSDDLPLNRRRDFKWETYLLGASGGSSSSCFISKTNVRYLTLCRGRASSCSHGRREGLHLG